MKFKIVDMVRFNHKGISIYHFCHVYEINNKYGFTFFVLSTENGSVLLGDLDKKPLNRSRGPGGAWYSSALELVE